MSQLHDGQTAFDRPDVATAVFKSRLDLMKKNIRNGKYFGGLKITYTFNVIEYQFCVLFVMKHLIMSFFVNTIRPLQYHMIEIMLNGIVRMVNIDAPLICGCV